MPETCLRSSLNSTLCHRRACVAAAADRFMFRLKNVLSGTCDTLVSVHHVNNFEIFVALVQKGATIVASRATGESVPTKNVK